VVKTESANGDNISALLKPTTIFVHLHDTSVALQISANVIIVTFDKNQSKFFKAETGFKCLLIKTVKTLIGQYILVTRKTIIF